MAALPDRVTIWRKRRVFRKNLVKTAGRGAKLAGITVEAVMLARELLFSLAST